MAWKTFRIYRSNPVLPEFRGEDSMIATSRTIRARTLDEARGKLRKMAVEMNLQGAFQLREEKAAIAKAEG